MAKIENRRHEALAKWKGKTHYIAKRNRTIENTNRLIRQYIPKGKDFKGFTDNYIKMAEQKLNTRPRKKNQFKTPNEMIQNIFL